jgi:2-polyprenyl-3-methyl-5-hydroxy-6-metoxy-1,4-benzoquinol methylase
MLHYTFVDLGMSPLCQSHIEPHQLNKMEPFYPLHVYVCEQCFLVQLEEYVSPEKIFTEYAYFSSYIDALLQNAKSYTDMIVERFNLDRKSQVVEIASNDGYLLQYFVQKGIPAIGIEPAANIAEVAIKKGIPTIAKFFGKKLAQEMASDSKKADLLLGNNVLSQVPNLNDFIAGMKILLKQEGVITMEFPHLVRLIERNEFDTIYHEHYSYFSLITVEKIFAAHGLTIFDLEEIPIHGGSLRIYAGHSDDASKSIVPRVVELRQREEVAGITKLEYYFAFDEQVKETKRKLLELLIKTKRDGKTIVGYGAPGKATTLLNYCGIRKDFIDYTVDRNPYKHGKFTAGTHIPIFHPDKIRETKPDFVLILPWNLKDEIMTQLDYVKEWGCKFIVPIPEAKIYP